MYCAKKGSSRVLLTDLYRCLQLLRQNVVENKCLARDGGCCEVLPYPWGTPLNRVPVAVTELLRQPKVLVLAADCTYDPGPRD
eukprot:1131439-Amphidinium_carterae.1